MTIYYVAIAGNIGVGKSTLTTLIAKKLGWSPFFEAVEEFLVGGLGEEFGDAGGDARADLGDFGERLLGRSGEFIH